MKNLFKKSAWLVVGALAWGLSAKADVLFNNTVTPVNGGTRFSDTQLEFGNQVILANPAGAYITNFSFEYYGIGGGAGGAFSGTVTVDVRWYLNNGPLTTGSFPTPPTATPGTLIYDSGPVHIVPTAQSTLDFSTATGDFQTPPTVIAPPTGTFVGWVPGNELTFTVQFSGLGTGDSAGVDLYSPPVVGSTFTDYWQNNGTASSPHWVLLEDATGRPIDIGQEWMGTAVPEPSTLALSLVGGLGLLVAVRRFRNK
jgi:hypothetical protein